MKDWKSGTGLGWWTVGCVEGLCPSSIASKYEVCVGSLPAIPIAPEVVEEGMEGSVPLARLLQTLN